MSIMLELLPSAGPALVVGGGAVAARKVQNLVEGGFAVTVIAPEIAPEIRAHPTVTLVESSFQPSDLPTDAPYALVFACTSDRETNRLVGELARRARIPALIADDQSESTFFTPATHRDGDLTVAVSTAGASPTLARDIRDRVAEALGGGWAEKVAAAREERAARIAMRKDAES